MSKINVFICKLLTLVIVGLLFMFPFQASAALTYTMTAFQSLGPLYASGEITGQLTGDSNISTLYSFCINNAADLYQGTPYSASLTSIAGTAGSVESAYLIDKYVPKNTALPELNKGVALQWAIWMALGQGSPLTANNLDTAYSSIYGQASGYLSEAQNQYNLGNLTQYVGMYQEFQLPGSQDLLLVPSLSSQDQLLVTTPVPAAVYLLGSGLLGLMGVRKKMLNS